MDSRTVPQPPRSGYHYPRYDARLHHGDEIKMKTLGQHWLIATEDPSFTLRGKAFALQMVSTGRFCLPPVKNPTGKVSCSETTAPRSSWFEASALRSLLSVRSGHGEYCSDRPDGIACNARGTGLWETWQFVDAGGGLVRLRGFRSKHFCASTNGGLVCNQASEHGATLFKLVADTELRPVLALSQDHALAATFVVHREDLDSPKLALLCKGKGRYLKADNSSGMVSCSSALPWYFLTARVRFNHIPGRPKWDLSSATLQSTETGQFMDPGGGWKIGEQVMMNSPRQVKLSIFLLGGCETFHPLIRGVNLGNWFLLERWMDQRLFRNDTGQPFADNCHSQDEYSLMSSLSPGVARQRMEDHWSTWITEKDIAWLSRHGINAVRVPFGYWMVFPVSPFLPGQLKYLDRLFSWCEKYSVSVLLDYHGLKGSQTGTPTSGNCGGCGDDSCGETWLNFLDEQEANLEVIRQLAVRYSHSPAYLGFAVANEVSGLANRTKLMSFYQRAYDIIRYQSFDALVILYITFAPALYPFDNFRQSVIDIHIYFGWGFGPPTLDQHVNLKRARRALAPKRWPVVVGEWTLAANGHNDTLTWEPHKRDAFFNKFAKMQLQAWETHSVGWFYWNYKTRYGNSTWNYPDMCKVGWLPGCTEELKFAPAEWWNTPPCAYAYFDGQCRDEPPTMEFIWLSVLATFVAAVAATGAAVMVVKPSGWMSGVSGVNVPMKLLRLPSLDMEQEPIMSYDEPS